MQGQRNNKDTFGSATFRCRRHAHKQGCDCHEISSRLQRTGRMKMLFLENLLVVRALETKTIDEQRARAAFLSPVVIHDWALHELLPPQADMDSIS